jgi:3-dehydroquinate synthase
MPFYKVNVKKKRSNRHFSSYFFSDFFGKVNYLQFKFNEYQTNVEITREIPAINDISLHLGMQKDNPSFKPLIIADENTSYIAEKIIGGTDYPCVILKSGEKNKTWQSTETILAAAVKAGLGRDGVFIAVGGGVIGDLAGFAASIYMRGCRFVLVSTTLLGMVDASVGGKTGFDFSGIKNLVGSFYPAQNVYMPLNALSTLSQREIKSGMAELIKTAILSGDNFLDELTPLAENFNDVKFFLESAVLQKCVEKAVSYKGKIVSEDFRESGKRMLLNLGHTFGHALESSGGLGNISHGEAVAWGIIRACELGIALNITPQKRAEKIKKLILSFGYECACPHPCAGNKEALLNAMKSDKKKKSGNLTFIVPDKKSAQAVELKPEDAQIIDKILQGELNF